MSTRRTTLHRHPERGSSDFVEIAALLDEAMICHVGFIDGGPVVIPSTYARDDDRLYLHGSSASRLMKILRSGADVSISVALLDGLVLDSSAFHHSLNYRSVVVFGNATEVTDPREKRAALEAIVEHLIPGRLPHLRPMTDQEVGATVVVSIPLSEASLKARTGPPASTEEWPVWTGVIPTRMTAGPPESSNPQLAIPAHVTEFAHRLP
ncbi:MAG: pyridoxamine 5'-phosphate oxidase family protein [Gammaproteobacteria bacterium]|nr:pyridoxamine 5'-phosphate oxidase family protein [Gammaproteobacteria bacterium]